MMVELRGLGTRPRLSTPPATQLGGSSSFLARHSCGPCQRQTQDPILLARINAMKENIYAHTYSFKSDISLTTFYLSLNSAGLEQTAPEKRQQADTSASPR